MKKLKCSKWQQIQSRFVFRRRSHTFWFCQCLTTPKGTERVYKCTLSVFTDKMYINQHHTLTHSVFVIKAVRYHTVLHTYTQMIKYWNCRSRKISFERLANCTTCTALMLAVKRVGIVVIRRLLPTDDDFCSSSSSSTVGVSGNWLAR